MISRALFWFFLILISSCQQEADDFIGIKMNSLYERELEAWSLKNSNQTYVNPPHAFPVKIYLKGKWFPAKIKIRGDLAKHWNQPAKSLRVYLRAGSYEGMKEFDLILPSDKNFELEGVANEYAKELGLPHLKYDFLQVQINHKKLGQYLLLERPKSLPVISENNAWLNTVSSSHSLYSNVFMKDLSFNQLALYPHIYQVSGNDKQSQEAMTKFAEMLSSMRAGNVKLDSFLSIEAFSKWLALVIYLGSEHAALGDNLRWQFDPVTSRFSPIIYDVLSFRRFNPSGKCLIDRFARMNPWVHEWVKNTGYKQMTYDHLRKLSEQNEFLKIWQDVEVKFSTARKFSAHTKERDEIKQRILQNIREVKENETHSFCTP